mgnify:CR=1 FL=1
MNVTEPVGVPVAGAAALTVAVKVTACPYTEGFADEPTDNPLGGPAPDHLAYVLYTSGSTGKPPRAGAWPRKRTG